MTDAEVHDPAKISARRFSRLPAAALADPRLSDKQVRVLAALCLRAHTDGTGVFAAARTLRQDSGGTSNNAFWRAIGALERLGYVKRESGKADGRTTIFSVLVPDKGSAPAALGGSAPEETGGSAPVALGVAHRKRQGKRTGGATTTVNSPTNKPFISPKNISAVDDRRPLKYGWLAPIRDAHEKMFGPGSFTKSLEGQFAGSWGELVKIHGGEKCAEHWRWAKTDGSEKDRHWRKPDTVAAEFEIHNPQGLAFPAETKLTPDLQRELEMHCRNHRLDWPELYNADGSRKEGTITNVPAATIAAPIDDTECPPSFKPWVRPVKLEDAA